MNRPSAKMLFALSVWTVWGLSSCEKMVLDSEGNLQKTGDLASLTITTRSDDNPNEGFLAQARVYIFPQTEECVQMLTIGEDTNTASVQLAPGTYRLCAVCGDPDRFTLPDQSEAMSISVIKLQEGKVMDDFLSKQVSITMTGEGNTTENINLERKVICLKKLEVKDVPANVVAVKITLSSFYDAILLNSTFPSSPIIDYNVSLNKQSDGTTWQATPDQLLFPSTGNPTINISFITATGTNVYSYTASEALEANHNYTISSTYKPQAKLSVTLTATNWDEERNVDFNFNDTNMTYLPVAGQYCNGYYVVSVNENARTAVLLSEFVLYDVPATPNDVPAWKAELEKQMAALKKPTNITGSWRLPTIDEVEIFTKDPNAVTFSEEGISAICFCEKENQLFWAYSLKKEDGSYEFNAPKSAPTEFTNIVRLRPVIDITY